MWGFLGVGVLFLGLFGCEIYWRIIIFIVYCGVLFLRSFGYLGLNWRVECLWGKVGEGLLLDLVWRRG